jgi:asparaginyl-tRNA synthetase
MYLSISELYTRIHEFINTDKDITIKGLVRSYRSAEAGKLHFININDGSTMKIVQCVYTSLDCKIDYMSSVVITGKIVSSPSKGQDWELSVNKLEIIGSCSMDEFPFAPRKKYGMDYLRKYPHLRMRTQTSMAIFRIRHYLWKIIMDFFHSKGFISIHTPLITSSDCEGAGETFKVDGGKDFFPEQAYLTVSGQLEAEMAATALGKIFTYGPTFRAEKSDTSKHLAEFWMVEPEMAWYDLDDTIQLSKELLTFCLESIKKECQEELKFLNVNLPEKFDFKQITYTDAIGILEESVKSKSSVEYFCQAPKWGEDLSTPHETFLADCYFKQPVIVTHYPKEIKAFYMYSVGNTVACFDVLMPGIGEIIGGSQRETRLNVLENIMIERKMDITKYKKYLDLRRFATMPHSGFGLGFERLVRFMTGQKHIRDVIPFPVYYGHLSS